MLHKILIWLFLSLISGWSYRAGGIGKPFNTKYRDFGVAIVLTAYLVILGLKVPWWAFLLNFGLLFWALTTYWGLDEQKWGFWAHGLGVSLSALPLAYFSGHWLGFGLRCIILTAFITWWSEIMEEVNLEEGGRGFAILATTPLLLI